MSNAINWDLLSKLCGRRSLAEVQTEIESFYALRSADLDKAAEVIKGIFQAASKQAHVRKPDLINAVLRRMQGDSLDPSFIDALTERAALVIDRDYKVERKSGVVNPFFVEPAPTSQQLAAQGNVR